MRLVVDHVEGARRGQRQELELAGRVRFGRHPDCEIAFDSHRDLDASARHAELRRTGERWLLIDLGSSNGTYVNQHRATEIPVSEHVPYQVRFGSGGPVVQLVIAEPGEQVPTPRPAPARRGPLLAVIGVVVAAAIAVAIWQLL